MRACVGANKAQVGVQIKHKWATALNVTPGKAQRPAPLLTLRAAIFCCISGLAITACICAICCCIAGFFICSSIASMRLRACQQE